MFLKWPRTYYQLKNSKNVVWLFIWQRNFFIEDKEGNKITNLIEINGLFKIGQHQVDDKALASYLSNKEANIQIWHQRLGHIGVQNMKKFKKMDDKLTSSKVIYG
jgi:hypothetical protein